VTTGIAAGLEDGDVVTGVELVRDREPGDTGADPIRTARTEDKSLDANSSGSRSIIAIIVGTEVRVVARCALAAAI